MSDTSATIRNLLTENRRYPVPEAFAAQANLDATWWAHAAADPVAFWAEQAKRLDWAEPWHTTHSWQPAVPDSEGVLSIPHAEWFAGGKLNVAVNCVDRHVAAGKGDKVAFYFEGEPGDRRTITYAELEREVAKAANALTALGIVQGDRVVLYLPVIPETIIVTLAIARLGAIELRVLWRTKRELFAQIQIANALFLFLAGKFIGDDPIAGTYQPSTVLFVAGFLSLAVIQVGLIQLPLTLATDRDDGTLLRVRGIPNGVTTYLIGRSVVVLVLALGNVVLMMLVAVVGLGAPLPDSLADWLTLSWVLALSIIAVAVLGACVGSLIPNARSGVGWVMIPTMVLMIISGALLPLGVMPGPVQWIAAVFPVKWMAQGIRSALYDDNLQFAEMGGTWQHGETALVLVAWIVGGSLVAPALLRRTTRRETGSRLESRREAASKRVGYE